jgi:hypothetical protein
MQSTRNSAYGLFRLLLLTVLYLGWGSAVFALDSSPAPNGKGDSLEAWLNQIAAQVQYWSTRCGEMEEAKKNDDASQCWLSAAREVSRYTTADHSLVEDIKQLRMDWLWRALQISLESIGPKYQASFDAAIVDFGGPHPARLAGPVACSSIAASDYSKCLSATATIRAAIAKSTQLRRKEAVTPRIARNTGKKIAARPRRAKTKLATTPVAREGRKKKVAKAVSVRKQEAALPVAVMDGAVLKVRKKSFARPYGWKSRNARDRHVRRNEL